MEHFYVIELKLSEYHELSWAYVNALQRVTLSLFLVSGMLNLIMKQWGNLLLYIQIIKVEYIKFR